MWPARNTNPIRKNTKLTKCFLKSFPMYTIDFMELIVFDALFQDFPFFSNDEYFVDAFAIFCGMGITNVMNFQAVSQANAKLKVSIIISIP